EVTLPVTAEARLPVALDAQRTVLENRTGARSELENTVVNGVRRWDEVQHQIVEERLLSQLRGVARPPADGAGIRREHEPVPMARVREALDTQPIERKQDSCSSFVGDGERKAARQPLEKTYPRATIRIRDRLRRVVQWLSVQPHRTTGQCHCDVAFAVKPWRFDPLLRSAASDIYETEKAHRGHGKALRLEHRSH